MKSEEIKKVIKGEVIHEWELLIFYTECFGAEDSLTCSQRAKWCVLDDLWKQLYPNEEYQKQGNNTKGEESK